MNSFKKVLTLLFVALIAVSVALPASAAKATYDDVPEQYVFSTTSKEDPTDLFENFKDAMPGDTLTQSIVIENKNTNRMAVKMFLRSLGADEDSKAFLSKLTLTVKEKGKSPFFEAAADQKTGMEDYRELGTVAPGGTVELEVSLSIPATLGNEYQNAVGKIKWQLKSEEQPIETKEKKCPNCDTPMEIIEAEDGHCIYRCPHCGHEEDMLCEVCGSRMKKKLVQGNDGKFYYYYECISPEKHHTPPVTGDESNMTLWIAIAGVALLGMIAFAWLLLRKKAKKQE